MEIQLSRLFQRISHGQSFSNSFFFNININFSHAIWFCIEFMRGDGWNMTSFSCVIYNATVPQCHKYSKNHEMPHFYNNRGVSRSSAHIYIFNEWIKNKWIIKLHFFEFLKMFLTTTEIDHFLLNRNKKKS